MNQAVFDVHVRNRNVKLFGQVSNEELDKIIKAADIAICPIQTGSGIQIKMLDYMASGLPIVTTHTGARGLGIDNEKHAIICDYKNFEYNIRRLFKNTDLFNYIKENAREKALEFDSKKLGRELEKILISKIQQKNEKRT